MKSLIVLLSLASLPAIARSGSPSSGIVDRPNGEGSLAGPVEFAICESVVVIGCGPAGYAACEAAAASGCAVTGPNWPACYAACQSVCAGLGPGTYDACVAGGQNACAALLIPPAVDES
eukprot:CAMPEP_0183308692 /NCGR_PEP_ID=MMETSP0160_2-20130417/22404_1 /TAXON_ID=2839 ORGANISM="Odontella Sinensis, Strain Grunow 1884" /NCGR_SAMPLE_ID=MMETSP0160_2 /ASSEMBLY_ACC=CAM_ASM_000250 /LENGTH=118 /DNA_ID=CAMNT_0025472567 /DNA_START=79 /DNA_END=435 /DNA_ORIENTATION=+